MNALESKLEAASCVVPRHQQTRPLLKLIGDVVEWETRWRLLFTFRQFTVTCISNLHAFNNFSHHMKGDGRLALMIMAPFFSTDETEALCTTVCFHIRPLIVRNTTVSFCCTFLFDCA